jgi:hypothetical protein
MACKWRLSFSELFELPPVFDPDNPRSETSLERLPAPPSTLCSCMVSETLAIAPQSQRHVCQILWLARSLLPQSSGMSPFRRPVSAAKNSVPGSRIGDRFDDWERSWQHFRTLDGGTFPPSASTDQGDACYSPPGARGAQVILCSPARAFGGF